VSAQVPANAEHTGLLWQLQLPLCDAEVFGCLLAESCASTAEAMGGCRHFRQIDDWWSNLAGYEVRGFSRYYRIHYSPNAGKGTCLLHEGNLTSFLKPCTMQVSLLEQGAVISIRVPAMILCLPEQQSFNTTEPACPRFD